MSGVIRLGPKYYDLRGESLDISRLEVTDPLLLESMRSRYGRDRDFYFLFIGTVIPRADLDIQLRSKPRAWNYNEKNTETRKE